MQLEEYPGLPSGDDPHGPLFAMRFLEMFSPIKRLTDDDYIPFPQEGKLLHRKRASGKLVPWGYSPSRDRKFYIDWIAQSRA